MKNTDKNSRHISLFVTGTLFFIAVLFVCLLPAKQTKADTWYGTFEEQLSRFPESYWDGIIKIHNEYPNYIFSADYIYASFDDIVYQQTLDHRKVVNLDYDALSWRSLGPACYNRYTGVWNKYCGNWTDAGVDVIEYYLDPRNFLNTKNMFIFAQQTYTGNESRSGVEAIAGNSFLSGWYTDSSGTYSYIDTIMEASRVSGVSPYVIAATIRSEQPARGNSPLIDGSYGFYNFFNFGASGSDVVGNGIAYARKQGWDTVYKSILGGAQGYYNGYLQYGQDTYFYKDFNVITGNYNHQYAQGVYDQIGNASFLRNAIGGDHYASLVLRIPVYMMMPETAVPYPPETNSYNARYNADGSLKPRSGGLVYMPENGSGAYSQPEAPQEVVNEPKSNDYMPGDANGDWQITALDYITVKNHIMGIRVITDPTRLMAADANADGAVSALDYICIKNTIMKGW